MAPAIDLARSGTAAIRGRRTDIMRDDSILLAIDEALGANSRCTCGRELFPRERADMLWLECPVFAGASRLPARLADYGRQFTHDRRPMAALPRLAPVAVVVPSRTAMPTARPVVARS